MKYEEGATVTVTVTLPWEAGNEYNVDGADGNALSTTIELAVGAVQANGAEAGTGKELKCKASTAGALKAALADGASVVLESDLLNVETQFVLNGNASLDLNGHTITKTASKSGSDYLFTVSEGAKSVIKNGAIIDEHSVDGNKGYVIYNHGELTLEDLNMESSHNTSSMICNFSNTQEDIAKLTINGGNYIGHDMITLKCDRWSETYINGGRIETNKNNNILCYGKLVIEDGEFISTAGNYMALVVSSGYYNGAEYNADVEINGGYFGGNILVVNGYGFYDTKNPDADYTRPGNTNVTINNAVIERSVSESITVSYNNGATVITHKLEKDGGDTLVIGENVKYATLVSSQDDWGTEIADGAIIKLAAGEYTIPYANVQNKTVEIIGSGKDTVIDRTGTPNFAGTKLTVKNATVKGTSANYNGFQHIDKETYINCVFEDKTFLYANDIEFIDCTFNTEVVDYNIWTYGAKNVTFTNCTFNCEGKAVLIYSEAAINSEVTFNDCTFNANKPADGKAAIEIDSSFHKDGKGGYTVNINNCTVNGFGTGSVSGNSLWNEKKGNSSVINVNGEKVRG